MPKQTKKSKEWFDATKFRQLVPSPIQQVAKIIIESDGVSFAHVFGTRQWGKTWIVFLILLWAIYNNPDEVFGVVIPLDSELDRFIAERLCDVLGKDENGRKCTNIMDVRVPVDIENEDGSKTTVMMPFVENFSKDGIPMMKFFNGARLMFYAGNANPEKHIPGNAFKMVVLDEYSKYDRNITKEIIPALAQKKGIAIASTTLNEDDAYNWYTTEVVLDYQQNAEKIIPEKSADLCGLEVYKKTFRETASYMRADGTEFEKEVVYKSMFIHARLSKCYPWIHNGQTVYERAKADLAMGNITQSQYNILYEGIPDTSELRVLSNFSRDNNTIPYQEDFETKYPLQLVGYDHGNGSVGRCNAAWARVCMILDPERPDFEQYIILDSSSLSEEEAESKNVSRVLDSFGIPVVPDGTLFKKSMRGEKPDIYHITKYSPGLEKRVWAAGGKKANNSQERIRFWQDACQVKKVDSGGHIYYTNPIDSSLPGCQIYVATDETDRNQELLDEAEQWQRARGKDGKVKERKRSKIDIWDAASMAIESFRKDREKILRFYRKKPRSKGVTKGYINRGYSLPGNSRINNSFSIR